MVNTGFFTLIVLPAKSPLGCFFTADGKLLRRQLTAPVLFTLGLSCQPFILRRQLAQSEAEFQNHVARRYRRKHEA